MTNFNKGIIKDYLGNEAEVGLFGALKVSEPISQLAQIFTIPLDTSREVTLDTITGAGSVIAQYNRSLLKVDSGAIGTAGIQTRKNLHYREAATIEVEFTANWSGAGVGVINHNGLIGLFDNAEGVYLGYQGVNFIVGYRNKYKTGYVVPASSGLADTTATVDMSAYTLTNLHRFKIKLGYLGIGNITFEIFDGVTWVLLHRFVTDAALSDRTHIGSPTLPLRCEVASTASAMTMFSGSWSAQTFGAPATTQNKPHFTHGIRTVVPGALGTGGAPVLAVRSPALFGTYPNKALSQLLETELATGSEGLYRYIIWGLPAGTLIDGAPGTVGAAEVKGNFAAIVSTSPLEISTDVAVGGSVVITNFTLAHSSLIAVASGAGSSRTSKATDYAALDIFATAGTEFLVTMEEIIAGAGTNTTAWSIAYVDIF